MEFKQEHEKYSIEELELIINTQQDLYTEEEMNCLVDILSQKRETADIERINNLPKEIECPKCDMINPIENEKCQYCEFEFGSDKYQYAIDNIDDYDDDIFGYIEHDDETYDNESDDIDKDMFSFIIPLVVFILLAILILT